VSVQAVKDLGAFRVGEVLPSRLGRTVTEADNVWFTCLTMNTNQSHFNYVYAEETRFGAPPCEQLPHPGSHHRPVGT
jgi:acyl dehydratase